MSSRGEPRYQQGMIANTNPPDGLFWVGQTLYLGNKENATLQQKFFAYNLRNTG